ncbi:tRNA uridine-5-carboxymethylaminomethyl(34) synthesis GTPase MnmE [Sphingoaurantiacus capsulatus]|uniref:tRNA modification GTPase MnmE n=1 Tax=Sphingoaurantiacus capsulatus TaxID=1771310 RepID=A0ABV7XI65_9SPHN
MATPATIYALSSGRPPAGVAIVRMSGPRALDALALLAGRQPEPRMATLTPLRDPADGSLIDQALVLSFPAPASFTGEDVAELHVHGGVAVVEALLAALGRIEDFRLAEPGEFSRRAFDNGKLDLTQAEGLSDLIAAQTDAQRRLALAQAGGRLRDKAEGWRSAIIALLASVEADIDFSDEGDVSSSDPAPAIERLRDDIGRLLDDGRIGERLRDGLAIAVVGAPNVGKSSLINALARRDVAIVTDIAGTTRDVIEVPLNLGGVPATLIDTAGLRETDDIIEREGIRRARARADAADLVLHVVDRPEMAPLGQVVVNKIDASGQAPGQRGGDLYVSAKSGAGVDTLEKWLVDWAISAVRTDEPPLITRERQRLALGQAVERLDDALAEPDLVLRAESLRLAARSLGRVTGRVDVEDILGEIFGRFCIGK